jgi:hypothetical protein
MDRIEQALAHLGAAIVQIAPSDDQIICDHLRAAHALVLAEFRARRGATAERELVA